jgi:hypothetical protein
MWGIAGSVVLILGGGCLIIYQMAENPSATIAAPAIIAIGIGMGQLIWKRRAWSASIWRGAGSAVLILGGGFWIFFLGSMGVMVFDNPSATIVTYLHAVIPIAAPGLIAVVIGVGQLIWK